MNKIVIPVYKNWRLCHDLLNDLRRHEKDNVGQVLVIDDCSNDPEVEGGLDFWVKANLFPVEVISNEENIGFTLSAITGLHYTCENSQSDDIVYLISSDVRINGKFLDRALEFATQPKTLVGHKLLTGNTGWNTFDGRIFPYLEGYFLACTAYGWRDLGYFDPAYAPYDYEDVDLSANASAKGYALAPLNNPVINHLGGRSIGYSAEREAITKKNREYFKRKWLDV